MESLANQNFIKVSRGELPLEKNEVARYLKQLDGWQTDEKSKKIIKKLSFSNFSSALSFVNDVSVLCEQANHHPDIAFGWGYCHLTLFTHVIHGLHHNDFILASRIDAIEHTAQNKTVE